MSQQTYRVFLPSTKKIVGIILLNLIFIGGVGFGVFQYDQYFPDEPLGDDDTFGYGTTTSDQKIHWVDTSFLDTSKGKNDRFLDLNTMNLDNEIESIRLLDDQNIDNMTSFIKRMELNAIGNDLLGVLQLNFLSEYAILFKITNPGERAIVDIAVVKMPENYSMTDFAISESLDTYTFSVIQSDLHAVWNDLSFRVLDIHQFNQSYYLDAAKNYTAIFQAEANSINWETADLPLKSVDLYKTIANEFDINFNPQHFYSGDDGFVTNTYRTIAEEFNSINQSRLTDIISEYIAPVQILDGQLIELPSLFYLDYISVNQDNQILGQGYSFDVKDNQTLLKLGDYFVIDPVEQLSWTWDLIDTPVVSAFEVLPKYTQFSGNTYYINSNIPLDERISANYQDIISNYSRFLDWAFEEQHNRKLIQLAWFDPTSNNGSRLSEIGQTLLQPTNWLTVHEMNSQTEIRNNNYLLYFDSITRPQIFEENNIPYLLFALSDGDGTDGSIELKSFYTYYIALGDLLSAEDDNIGDIGNLTLVREAPPDLNIDVNQMFLRNIMIREKDGKTQLLLIYKMINILTEYVFPENYYRIMTIGGNQDE